MICEGYLFLTLSQTLRILDHYQLIQSMYMSTCLCIASQGRAQQVLVTHLHLQVVSLYSPTSKPLAGSKTAYPTATLSTMFTLCNASSFFSINPSLIWSLRWSHSPQWTGSPLVQACIRGQRLSQISQHPLLSQMILSYHASMNVQCPTISIPTLALLLLLPLTLTYINMSPQTQILPCTSMLQIIGILLEEKEKLPPHIFQLANNAYYHMRRTTQDQSVIPRWAVIIYWKRWELIFLY